MDRVPQTSKRLGLANNLKGLQHGMRKPEWLGHARWLTYLGPVQRQRLYRREFLSLLDGYDTFGQDRKSVV